MTQTRMFSGHEKSSAGTSGHSMGRCSGSVKWASSRRSLSPYKDRGVLSLSSSRRLIFLCSLLHLATATRVPSTSVGWNLPPSMAPTTFSDHRKKRKRKGKKRKTKKQASLNELGPVDSAIERNALDSNLIKTTTTKKKKKKRRKKLKAQTGNLVLESPPNPIVRKRKRSEVQSLPTVHVDRMVDVDNVSISGATKRRKGKKRKKRVVKGTSVVENVTKLPTAQARKSKKRKKKRKKRRVDTPSPRVDSRDSDDSMKPIEGRKDAVTTTIEDMVPLPEASSMPSRTSDPEQTKDPSPSTTIIQKEDTNLTLESDMDTVVKTTPETSVDGDELAVTETFPLSDIAAPLSEHTPEESADMAAKTTSLVGNYVVNDSGMPSLVSKVSAVASDGVLHATEKAKRPSDVLSSESSSDIGLFDSEPETNDTSAENMTKRAKVVLQSTEMTNTTNQIAAANIAASTNTSSHGDKAVKLDDVVADAVSIESDTAPLKEEMSSIGDEPDELSEAKAHGGHSADFDHGVSATDISLASRSGDRPPVADVARDDQTNNIISVSTESDEGSCSESENPMEGSSDEFSNATTAALPKQEPASNDPNSNEEKSGETGNETPIIDSTTMNETGEDKTVAYKEEGKHIADQADAIETSAEETFFSLSEDTVSRAGSSTAESRVSRQTKIDSSDVYSDEDDDFTVAVVTWNLAEESPPEEDAAFIKKFRGSKHSRGSDFVLISGQECENIKPRRAEGRRSREYRRLMVAMLGKEYVPVALHLLGGIQFGLFCRRDTLADVEEVTVADVTCGIGNVFHNKGAIAAFVKMKSNLKQGHAKSLRMLFVTAHMAAHVKHVEARNADFWRIASELEAQAPPRFLTSRTMESGEHNGSNLMDSMDRIFFCGDLNYRLDLPRETAQHTVNEIERLSRLDTEDAKAQVETIRRSLLRHDQLKACIAEDDAFPNFAEGDILFAPTFKFDKGTKDYDTSHKNRIPAWTDRVLFKPVGTRVLEYASVPDSCHSDHRPVYATFRVNRLGRVNAKGPSRPRRRRKKRKQVPLSELTAVEQVERDADL